MVWLTSFSFVVIFILHGQVESRKGDFGATSKSPWANTAKANSFMNCLIQRIYASPAFPQQEKDDLESIVETMLSAITRMSSSHRRHNAAQLQAMNMAFASSMAELVIAEDSNNLQAVAVKTEALCQTLSTCFRTTMGMANRQFISEIRDLIKMFAEEAKKLNKDDIYNEDERGSHSMGGFQQSSQTNTLNSRSEEDTYDQANQESKYRDDSVPECLSTTKEIIGNFSSALTKSFIFKSIFKTGVSLQFATRVATSALQNLLVSQLKVDSSTALDIRKNLQNSIMKIGPKADTEGYAQVFSEILLSGLTSAGIITTNNVSDMKIELIGGFLQTIAVFASQFGLRIPKNDIIADITSITNIVKTSSKTTATSAVSSQSSLEVGTAVELNVDAGVDVGTQFPEEYETGSNSDDEPSVDDKDQDETEPVVSGMVKHLISVLENSKIFNSVLGSKDANENAPRIFGFAIQSVLSSKLSVDYATSQEIASNFQSLIYDLEDTLDSKSYAKAIAESVVPALASYGVLTRDNVSDFGVKLLNDFLRATSKIAAQFGVRLMKTDVDADVDYATDTIRKAAAQILMISSKSLKSSSDVGNDIDASKSSDVGNETDAAKSSDTGNETDAAKSSDVENETDAAKSSDVENETDASKISDVGNETDASGSTALEGMSSSDKMSSNYEKPVESVPFSADSTSLIAGKIASVLEASRTFKSIFTSAASSRVAARIAIPAIRRSLSSKLRVDPSTSLAICKSLQKAILRVAGRADTRMYAQAVAKSVISGLASSGTLTADNAVDFGVNLVGYFLEAAGGLASQFGIRISQKDISADIKAAASAMTSASATPKTSTSVSSENDVETAVDLSTSTDLGKVSLSPDHEASSEFERQVPGGPLSSSSALANNIASSLAASSTFKAIFAPGVPSKVAIRIASSAIQRTLSSKLKLDSRILRAISRSLQSAILRLGNRADTRMYAQTLAESVVSALASSGSLTAENASSFATNIVSGFLKAAAGMGVQYGLRLSQNDAIADIRSVAKSSPSTSSYSSANGEFVSSVEDVPVSGANRPSQQVPDASGLGSLLKSPIGLNSPQAARRIQKLANGFISALGPNGLDYGKFSQILASVSDQLSLSGITSDEAKIEALLETMAALIQILSNSKIGRVNYYNTSDIVSQMSNILSSL